LFLLLASFLFIFFSLAAFVLPIVTAIQGLRTGPDDSLGHRRP
jgi:hypothetical protein